MAIELQNLCPLLQVFDMPASLRFYRDILGFEVISSSPPRGPDDLDWAWLKRKDAALMLNTRYEFDSRPPAPHPASALIHDDVGLYIGCPDLDGAYTELRAKGLALDPPRIAPYGMKQLYLKDPDGYVLCLQCSV